MKNYSLKDTAEKYLGQTEIKGNMGFMNPDFQRKMELVGWVPSHAWCVYFAELVWTEAFQGDEKMLKIIKKTFSGSAVKTFFNFNKVGMISEKPMVGAVALYQKIKQGEETRSGHAGIVVEVHKDYYVTIDGNTTGGGGREGYIVAKRKHKYYWKLYDGLQLIGFVNPEADKKKPKQVFKNKSEGDDFRLWVNTYHEDYAKSIDLDKEGSHTNSFIMKAWNKLGKKYVAKK